MKRIFIIVLDSFGIGALPDAKSFGDSGANTLASCVTSGGLMIPNMIGAGLGRIHGVTCLPKGEAPVGAWGRMAEKSMGKDTTIGHWELAGLISDSPLPTYPDGFPEEILTPFREQTGRGVLANAPWSGTEVIEAFGKQHMETGDLIVYTSADSVFQIAAHEEIVPPEQLYAYCRIARKILRGKHGIGRVIARPFVGTPGNFTRTANRHDFSLEPPEATLLDALKAAGLSVIGVGKIQDIFAGQGLTEYVYNKSNANGMEHALAYAQKNFRGLCFVNLVDFDSQFGHRRDSIGYAKALNEFDAWLPQFLEELGEEDLVFITADHGCDPGFMESTDHTREYVPLLALGKGVQPQDLGTRESFADLAATVAELLGVAFDTPGKSFADRLLKR
ncbi:MAG: phosphopentomutase [Oscillospiraceae bacterium]|nr:phosphopentomutase [Oscillospiraceae bacterium]